MGGTICSCSDRVQGTEESRQTWFFEEETREWHEIGLLNQGKSFFSSVVIEGQVYALGAVIERFDLDSRQWVEVYRNQRLPTSHFAAAAIDGKIAIVSHRIQLFDPVGNTLQEIPWWPGRQKGDHFHCVASSGNVLHIVGGLDGSTFEPTTEHWAFTEDRWVQLPNAPQPVYAKFGVVEILGGRLFIFSDQTGLAYDLVQKKWSVLPTMPAAVSMPASFVRAGRIYVLGGLPAKGESHARQVFDVGSEQWLNR